MGVPGEGGPVDTTGVGVVDTPRDVGVSDWRWGRGSASANHVPGQSRRGVGPQVYSRTFPVRAVHRWGSTTVTHVRDSGDEYKFGIEVSRPRI